MKYQIVCHDKKTFEITEAQKEAIYKLSTSNAKGIDINGEFIFFGNIARIEKTPEQLKNFKSLPEPDRIPIKGLKQLRDKMDMLKIQ